MKRMLTFMLVMLVLSIACENQMVGEVEIDTPTVNAEDFVGQVPNFESSYVHPPIESSKALPDVPVQYLIEDEELGEGCAEHELSTGNLSNYYPSLDTYVYPATGSKPGPYNSGWYPYQYPCGSWPAGSCWNGEAKFKGVNVGTTGPEYGVQSYRYKIEMIDWNGDMQLYNIAINNNWIAAPNYGSSYQWSGSVNSLQKMELFFFNYPTGTNDPRGEALYVTMRVTIYSVVPTSYGCHDIVYNDHIDIRYVESFDI